MTRGNAAMNGGIAAMVQDYLSRHPDDAPRLSRLTAQLTGPEDVTARSNMAGHVTGSTLTLDPTRTRALLIHHMVYDTEIPPGGHLDPGEDAYAAAIRERTEETAMSGTRPAGGRPMLLDIDTHPIPARPSKGEGPHWHHDTMWLELADHEFDPVIQESEISAARWVTLGEMMRGGGRNARLAARVIAQPEGMLK